MSGERTASGRRRVRGALGALALSTVASTVSAAERGPVLLLEPSRLPEPGREALSRFEGELRGAEIPVIRRELPELDDPSAALERESREQPSAFACTVDAQGSDLRLWLYDGAAHRLSVQHWHGDDPRGPGVLAVQGMELLRASWSAPLAPASPPAASASVADTATPQPAPAAQRAWHYGVELGVASLYEPAARAGSYLPLVRGFVGGRGLFGAADLGWSVRLGAGAFGSGLTLRAAAGSARVEPSVVLADALLEAFPTAPLTPFATLGAGVSELHVEGSASPGFYAQSSSSRALLGGAGLGVLAHPFEPLGLRLEAQSWFAAAPTRVRIAADELPGVGQPSLLVSATLVLTP